MFKRVFCIVLTCVACSTDRSTDKVLEEVQALNQASFDLSYSDLDSSKVLAEKALQMAKTHDLVDEEIRALDNIGYYYYEQKNFDSTAKYYQSTLEIAKNINNPLTISKALNSLGQLYYEMGSYDAAYSSYTDALTWLDQVEEEQALPTKSALFNNTALIFKTLGDKEEATRYFLEAIEINKRLDLPRKLATNYQSLGNFLLDEGDIDKAKEYTEKAISLSKANQLDYILAGSQMNMAIIENKLGNVDKANKLDSLSLIIVQKDNIVDFEAQILQNLGTRLIGYERLEEAEKIYKTYLNLEKEVNSKTLKANGFYFKSKFKNQQGEYDQAKLFLDSAFYWNRQMPNPYQELRFREYEAEFFSGLNASSQLAEARARIIDLISELKNQEKEKLKIAAQIKFEVEEKNQQLQALKLDQFRSERQIGLSISFILILLTGSTGLFFHMKSKEKLSAQSKRIQALEIKELKKRALLKEQELGTIKRDLSSKTDIINKLDLELEEIKRFLPENEVDKAYVLNQISQLRLMSEADWLRFKELIHQLDPYFFARAKEKIGDLTPTEEKLIVFYKLEMNSYQMAELLGVSLDAVKKARHRLRKKLAVEPEIDLHQYMSDL